MAVAKKPATNVAAVTTETLEAVVEKAVEPPRRRIPKLQLRRLVKC